MDYALIGIIPGAKAIWRSLRLALFIVAMFSLGGSWLLSCTASYPWLTYIAFVHMFVNMFYIILIIYATRLTIRMNQMIVTYILGYILLIMSSVPTLLMFLCGLDYSLFEILSWYILLDINKLVLPIATIVFLSVTYWLPVREIRKIQKTYEIFIGVKNKNTFQRILWTIAGAEIPILEKCRTDHKKFGAIGATIAMTSFIAFLSGTSAAWFFTQSGTETSGKIGWAMAFGIVWATLIFCIDRSLVITMKKESRENVKNMVGGSIRVTCFTCSDYSIHGFNTFGACCF